MIRSFKVPAPPGWKGNTERDTPDLADEPEYDEDLATGLLEHDIAKKSIATKKVEGCYSSNTAPWMWKHTGQRFDFGNQNSNHKCQEKCRTVGKILAATKGTWCYCGNIFPKGLKVDNR